jgi:predicted transcriptional regulator
MLSEKNKGNKCELFNLKINIYNDMIINMKNLQIALEDNIVFYLDRMAAEQHKTRTALIREALRHWIMQGAVEKFEADWIAALKSDQRDYTDDAELWMAAEAWEEE